ncbi:phosphotransferase family protein [Thalassobius sp. Cn5-15]|uniref:phosphotransferase family protein n=1 Tax=Thalassobius sp. Cn5-15 TaxID=2917763 RepID=UPI001EF291AA|nr:aminoglycoside phosphotransferase family protein [Thalassobius sp. Cn5-15]MCG7494031.1 aminoglycoside phosphotransferase family protein [Thalassobius sp. Cn5-15]
MAPPPQKLPDHVPIDLADYIKSLDLLPQNAVWHPLQGGQTNRLWHLCGGGAQIVVKLFSASGATPLFPNDPAQEAVMLRHLAPQDLAPALLHSGQCAVGAVLIYAHQEGTPWQTDAARAGQLLRRLHLSPAPTGLRQILGGSAMVEAQVTQMLPQLGAPLQEQLTRLKPQTTITGSDLTCLLHGDPVPGNILTGNHPAQDMLIDWQCPAIGDPVEDLAIFLSPAMQQIYRGRVLTAAEQRAFLAGYGNDAIHPRIKAMAPWHHWRMATYCGWKSKQGSAAYTAALPLELAALEHCANQMQ